MAIRISEQAQATLRHAEDTNDFLTAIDEIRRNIAVGVESGRIGPCFKDHVPMLSAEIELLAPTAAAHAVEQAFNAVFETFDGAVETEAGRFRATDIFLPHAAEEGHRNAEQNAFGCARVGAENSFVQKGA
ncbi:hypothetical protein [Mesorhizobium sp.]|uniref:hypothetical protein n=1 Tax=Mesorhizobium sp. TaxID=1871066 RepID=UPI00257A2868|nr:hypothetical protein [Mesorhizobium sp.]